MIDGYEECLPLAPLHDPGDLARPRSRPVASSRPQGRAR